MSVSKSKSKENDPVTSSSTSSSASNSTMGFWLYVIGTLVIILSNLWLLNKGTNSSADDIYYHVLLNLFAVCLLIGGWWMRSSADHEQLVKGDRDRDRDRDRYREKYPAEKNPSRGEKSVYKRLPPYGPRAEATGGMSRRSLEQQEANVAAEIQRFLEKGTGNGNGPESSHHEFLEKFNSRGF